MMRRFIYSLILLLIHQASIAAITWNTEFVHKPHFFRLDSNSVVYDSAGNPHIFYGANGLYHATKSITGWQIETIDDSQRVGLNATATIDTSGAMHVLYRQFLADTPVFASSLKYATNKSGNWQFETIDSSLEPSDYYYGAGAVATDSNNKVHIVYKTGRKLVYVTNTTGSWVFNTIDADVGDKGGGEISIAIDSKNFIHVMYMKSDSSSNIDLVHSTNLSGNWVASIIYNLGSITAFPSEYRLSSLVIDASDNLHAAFIGANYNLYYATNKSGSWVSDIVENFNGSHIGLYPSIKLDSNNIVHIASVTDVGNPYSFEIHLADNSSGQWASEILATYSRNVFFPNLHIDQSDNLHISYFELENLSLHYMSNETGNWSNDVVDRSEEDVDSLVPGVGGEFPYPAPVGLFSKLYQDNNGVIHFSHIKAHYIDYQSRGATFPDGYLMHTFLKNNEYVSEQLTDSFHSDNRQNAILVDEYGFTHIVYSNQSQLYYANNVSGAWISEVLDNAWSTGNLDNLYTDNIELKEDKQGYLHVAYIRRRGTNPNIELVYANNKTGAWSIESVSIIEDTLTNYGTASRSNHSLSMAIDDSGSAHIAYEDRDGNIRYATNSSGAWIDTIVGKFDISHEWWGLDLFVTPTGIIHMAYEAYYCTGTATSITCFPEGIKYASNISGVWVTEFVDNSVSFASDAGVQVGNPALILDSSGRPFITYNYFTLNVSTSETYQALVSSHKVGTLWRRNLIELGPNYFLYGLDYSSVGSGFLSVTQYNSMILDKSGDVLVSYYDWANGGLKLATSKQISGPMIDVDLPDLNFTNEIVGTAGDREIVIKNIGTSDLNIGNIELVGADLSDFTLNFQSGSQSCGAKSTVIPPNSQCSIKLGFSPKSDGVKIVSVYISSDDPDIPLLIINAQGSTSSTSSSGAGGGGGCVYNPKADFDPMLPLMLFISCFYFWRKKYQIILGR